jgi:heme-degrading monooxygenase HmoA
LKRRCSSPLTGSDVTIARFADLESHQSWAKHPEHLAAQRRGREEFYSWYSVRVAEEDYSRDFERDD